MASKIIKCTCKSEYQDKKYGAGNRVSNEVNKTPGQFRCTVCGSIKGASQK